MVLKYLFVFWPKTLAVHSPDHAARAGGAELRAAHVNMRWKHAVWQTWFCYPVSVRAAYVYMQYAIEGLTTWKNIFKKESYPFMALVIIL